MTASADESLAAQSLEAWSRRHGDYDVSRSRVVRCWLRLVWALSKPLARVPPDALSAAGVLTAAAAVVTSPRPGAGLVLTTAVLDGVDGAVAHRQRRAGGRGARVDTAADRVTDVLFLLALAGAGARRSFVATAAVGTAALEAQRAMARRHGEPVTTVTPGERPFRVAYVALGLVTSPSAGAAVVAGTTFAGALSMHRVRRHRSQLGR